MIIVFDASSLVSAAIRTGSLPDVALIIALSKANTFLLSDDILAEYSEVLSRPKFANALPVNRRIEMLDAIGKRGRMIDLVQAVQECADPKDDKYLALALAGRADVIVSSDDHLLRLNPWRGIAILNPKNFIARAATLPG